MMLDGSLMIVEVIVDFEWKENNYYYKKVDVEGSIVEI